MKLGSCTFNLFKDSDLETIITTLENCGYEAVELRTGHPHGVEPSIGPAEREKVRERFAASSVRLLAYGTVVQFHSPDPDERARQLADGKAFADLAADTGALGLRIRPNDLPEEVPYETTIRNIGEGTRALADYAAERGVEVWMEIHGSKTYYPHMIADMMNAANHPAAGVCWNSTGPDIVDGSVKASFELLRPWIRNVHIHELTDDYPYRELFALLKGSGYDMYTLAEVGTSGEIDRYLRYYRALWGELCGG